MVPVTLAATGHRPNKLVGIPLTKLHWLAERELRLEKQSDVYAISGMAQGWDTIWAETCVRIGVPFTAAVPFEGQERNWSSDERRRYRWLLAKADEVICVSKDTDVHKQPWYHATKLFHQRNIWMVDNCTKLVALWNGDTTGGTYHCVKYAQRVGKPYVNLWEHI